MSQMLCILTALCTGYLFKTLPIKMVILNKILLCAVITILFVMGYNFGSGSNFFSNILHTFKIVSVVSINLFVINFLFIIIYSRIKLKNQFNTDASSQETKLGHYFIESCKYLSYIILGIVIGYFLKIPLTHLNLMINLILLIVLFIIGFQLRHQGRSLKTVLLNKTGITIAVLIVISSAISGIISAQILGINTNIGLVLSSGFGWYTLSGILSGQLINAEMGAASFFIDFSREIIAIIIIPIIGRFEPLACVGYCGSTALDFTLPVIKTNLHEENVPIAITSGMILTILVPILIPLVRNF